jgi:hypothetical protein
MCAILALPTVRGQVGEQVSLARVLLTAVCSLQHKCFSAKSLNPGKRISAASGLLARCGQRMFTKTQWSREGFYRRPRGDTQRSTGEVSYAAEGRFGFEIR